MAFRRAASQNKLTYQTRDKERERYLRGFVIFCKSSKCYDKDSSVMLIVVPNLPITIKGIHIMPLGKSYTPHAVLYRRAISSQTSVLLHALDKS
jgi:hypothetical protein